MRAYLIKPEGPQRLEYEIWEEKNQYGVIQILILKMKGKTVKIQKVFLCDSVISCNMG